MDLIRDIEISKDGAIDIIRCEKRSDTIYYCLESPVFVDIKLYGCEIEVKEEGGKLKFVKVHKESSYTTHVYTWSKEFLGSEKGMKLKKKILDLGGDWEQVMGGILFIYLPREKDDMLGEILKIVEQE